MKIKNTILSALGALFLVASPVVNAAPENTVADLSLTVPSMQVDADTEAAIIAIMQNMLGNMKLNITATQAQEMLSKAKTGETEAVAGAGFLYFCGIGGVEGDMNKGMSYLVKAAKQGHEEALMTVGGVYMSGMFGEEYVEKGIKVMEYLAEHDNVYAMYTLGLFCLAEGDFEMSSYWYNRVVSKNDPKFNQMLKYIKQSMLETAEQGDALAQTSVAGMYLYGACCFEENHKEAFKWCKRAAAQGEPDAILMLGGFYEEGIGTLKNTQKAIYYYKQAAEMGVEGAQEALDALKATMK